eukprot:457416-Rhodomonas_salina.2
MPAQPRGCRDTDARFVDGTHVLSDYSTTAGHARTDHSSHVSPLHENTVCDSGTPTPSPRFLGSHEKAVCPSGTVS